MGSHPIEFEVPVDGELKCTSFRPFKLACGIFPVLHCGKRRETNPHMRGFWAATLGFFLAFVGWFAFAPLWLYVRKDIGACDNFEEVAMDIENSVCICESRCKRTFTDANIASVGFDVVVRFMFGTVIERIGPVKADCLILIFGAITVAGSAFVTSVTGYMIARFFVSAVGSTFVVNQFWNSILFHRSVKGTANATAGGWGNLGGGVTQPLMVSVYFFWHEVMGFDLHYSWRCAMAVPTAILLLVALYVYFSSQDTPLGQFHVGMLGKATRAGPTEYLKVMSDYRVVFVFLQYGACFGCELTMNNVLTTHFHDYLGMSASSASLMAFAYGAMNLFARSLGGILSDVADQRWGICGRLRCQFFCLFGEAVFLFLFGCVTREMGWKPALVVEVIFGIFVKMSEGTTYGIVPFMKPSELAIVSAIVGSGGTFGAIIAGFAFYRNVHEPLLPFRMHGAYVMMCALSVLTLRWDHLGSFFRVEKRDASAIDGEASCEALLSAKS